MAEFADLGKILEEEGLTVAKDADGLLSIGSNGLKIAEAEAEAASKEFVPDMIKSVTEDPETFTREVTQDAPTYVQKGEETGKATQSTTKATAADEKSAYNPQLPSDIADANAQFDTWGTRSTILGVGTAALVGAGVVAWECTNGVPNIQIINITNGSQSGVYIVRYDPPKMVDGFICYRPCVNDVVEFTGTQTILDGQQPIVTRIISSSSFEITNGIATGSVPANQSGGTMMISQTIRGSLTCTLKNTLGGVLKGIKDVAGTALEDVWNLIKKFVIWGGIILIACVLVWIIISLLKSKS
jgi:hypothetical protein